MTRTGRISTYGSNIGQNLSTLQEGIAGVRVIQAYAREPNNGAGSNCLNW